MVQINGKPVDAAGKTILEYLQTTSYKLESIAVERNEEIIPKSKYSEVMIQDEDVIEVVSFVGGD